jgi:cellulose synthase/poly-beta-1,6-N-acetylglucosamine synthase-like glycosyltransferase
MQTPHRDVAATFVRTLLLCRVWVKGRLQLVAADSRYRRKGHCCDPTDQYMRALVSILIPAYNAKEWVGAAIGSGLGQTWRQKEIIVVDHGSTDGTLAVARQFESNDVPVVTQPNQGDGGRPRSISW